MKRHPCRPALISAAIAAAIVFDAHAVRIDYTLDAGIERDDNVTLSQTDPVEQGPRTFLRRPAAATRGRQREEIGEDRTALMQMMADNGVFEHAHRLEYLQILKGPRQAAAGEQVR